MYFENKRGRGEKRPTDCGSCLRRQQHFLFEFKCFISSKRIRRISCHARCLEKNRKIVHNGIDCFISSNCDISDSFIFICHQTSSYYAYSRIIFFPISKIRIKTKKKKDWQMRAMYEYWTNISRESYNLFHELHCAENRNANEIIKKLANIYHDSEFRSARKFVFVFEFRWITL